MERDMQAGSILFLLNGGDFTRHYLLGMLGAATELGIRSFAIEMNPIWECITSGTSPQGSEIIDLIRRENVRLVISSSLNGSWEWPVWVEKDGTFVPFFEQHGVKHLMWWTDHPHWAGDKIGLRADLQPMLRRPNHHHFLKSESAAAELRDLLGWSKCHFMPVAEVPEFLKPVQGVKAEFDVVAIVGSVPRLNPIVADFLNRDDPNPDDIVHALAPSVVEKLQAIWRSHAPREMHGILDRFGRRWVEARCARRRTPSYTIFRQLESDDPDAVCWIRANPRVYFHAVEALWDLGHWERAFTLVYLSRFFRVGVFGMDWSDVGLGGSDRIEHVRQPQVYALGKTAINISQGNDESGVSHKPFQMAACGVAMLHNRVDGLHECFKDCDEVVAFDSPGESRDKLAELLSNPARREALAEASRQRLLREHTWRQRLPQMMEKMGMRFVLNTPIAPSKHSTLVPAST